jgi:hypothetical protein
VIQVSFNLTGLPASLGKQKKASIKPASLLIELNNSTLLS